MVTKRAVQNCLSYRVVPLKNDFPLGKVRVSGARAPFVCALVAEMDADGFDHPASGRFQSRLPSSDKTSDRHKHNTMTFVFPCDYKRGGKKLRRTKKKKKKKKGKGKEKREETTHSKRMLHVACPPLHQTRPLLSVLKIQVHVIKLASEDDFLVTLSRASVH